LGLVEQATFLRGSRYVCVIDGGVRDEPNSLDDRILRQVDGVKMTRYRKTRNVRVDGTKIGVGLVVQCAI
jgi:hypothetical protein